MHGDYQTAKILHETRLREAEERRRATESRQAALQRRRRKRGPSLTARVVARRLPVPGRQRRPWRRRRLAAWLRPLLTRR
jgi:hypothetical protein